MRHSSGDSANVVVQVEPLLETKFHVPRQRSGLIRRDRLTHHLEQGATRKLTLVSAPAGSGKSTLVAEWVTQLSESGQSTAWLSLDPTDNEPTFFWAYLIRALKRACPRLGEEAMARVASRDQIKWEALVSVLINELVVAGAEVTLVLDDYHVIDSEPIHQGLAFLIDRQPPGLRLIVVSRNDPPIPLARLRAKGELAELRAGDLQFGPEETRTFLKDGMSLELQPADSAELERRTEGWIAGLKLAAIALREGGEVNRLAAPGGDLRYVADYLVEDVVRGQPEPIRRFLMDTAVLEKMSAPLCDSVTGMSGSQAMLDHLERSNLFLISLDNAGHWYRYHHLFGEALRVTASRVDPDRVRKVHRRASLWFEERGSAVEAVQHALSSGDPERAAGLLEVSWPARDRSHRSARWLECVKLIPEPLLERRPVLIMAYAWSLLNSGQLDLAVVRLGQVERWLAGASGAQKGSEGPLVVDNARYETLPQEAAAARVYLAQARGSQEDTRRDAEATLRMIPEADHTARATGLALLALSSWSVGDLDAAFGTFSQALEHMRLGGNVLDALRGAFVLGDLRAAQGRLAEAVSLYEEGLRQVQQQPDPSLAEVDELYQGLSDIHLEWGDVDAARRYLNALEEAGTHPGHVVNRHRWYTANAAVLEATGKLDESLDCLEQAEQVLRLDPLPRPKPTSARIARIWVKQGRLVLAERWARTRGLSPRDIPTYLTEFELATLARILVARSERGHESGLRTEVLPLLDNLEEAALAGGRMGGAIDAALLKAIAFQRLGEARGAVDAIAKALAVAETEGFILVFLDQGPPAREVLQLAVAKGRGGSFAREVLKYLEVVGPGTGLPRASNVLTARELEILVLVAEGLRNEEIADRLFISPATVKRHLANIYEKFEVRHRTEALLRAKALNLL